MLQRCQSYRVARYFTDSPPYHYTRFASSTANGKLIVCGSAATTYIKWNGFPVEQWALNTQNPEGRGIPIHQHVSRTVRGDIEQGIVRYRAHHKLPEPVYTTADQIADGRLCISLGVCCSDSLMDETWPLIRHPAVNIRRRVDVGWLRLTMSWLTFR